MSFLQEAKNAEVIRGKIWAVRRILKCFPTKSLKLIPHQIDSMGTGVIMEKDDSVRQHSRAFWLYRVFQHPQPPINERHLSALLCFPPFPMLVEHTLHYAHLPSNKDMCGPVRFHCTTRTRREPFCLVALWFDTPIVNICSEHVVPHSATTVPALVA